MMESKDQRSSLVRQSGRGLALGIVVLLGSIACTNDTPPQVKLASSDKQVYRVNVGNEPNSYDPTQQAFPYEAAVGRQVFESLLRANSDNSDVVGAGASSYDVSEDELTYTFHLRSGAKWSDGKSVVASEWVYGYKHLLNPALEAGFVSPFFDGTIAGGSGYGAVGLKNVKAIDDYLAGLSLSAPDASTFVIKLAAPAAYFKWVVALWVAVPLRQDIVEAAAGGSFVSTDSKKAEMWAQSPSTIIGNGPFQISEIVGKDHVTVVPNQNYWGGKSKLQKIVFYFISDGATALAQYRNGLLDQVNVPMADVSAIQRDPVLSKQAKLTPRLTSFWLDFNYKNAILSNQKVRLALSKSIDRELLVNSVLRRTAAAQTALIPNGMAGHDKTDKAQSFDVVAAKALLLDSGVSLEDINKLKLLTRSTAGNKAINQFIVDQWNANLGTNIQLDVLDSKTVTTKIRKGQFDIYGPSGWVADYPDQQNWFDIFLTSSCHSLNFGCPVLKDYDNLIAKADGELSQTQRNADYLVAQHQLVDEAAVGFLYQQYEYDLVAPYVSHLKLSAFDDDYVPGDLSYFGVYITQH